MKPLLFWSLFPALLAFSSVQAADTFTIDKAHSTIGFEVRHLFSKVPGKFKAYSGAIQYDETAPENSSVEVTIEAKSIDTANEKRDTHLRSADFFDVAKYPQITFKSKSVKKTGEGKFEVTGDFTLHGVTKEVVLNAELLGKGAGPEGSVVSGWEATTTIKRSDYGLTWSGVVEGTQVVGDEISIDLKVEADKKK